MAKAVKKTDPVALFKENSIKWKEITATFLVLSLLVVQPLIITNQVYLNITITKLISFIAIVSLALVMLGFITIISAFMIPGYFKTKAGLLKTIRPYEYALGAYWLIMVISTILSPDKIVSLIGVSERSEGLLVMTLYFASALIIGRCYKPKDKHLFVFCVVACIISVYGIFQYYGLDFLHFNPPNIPDIQGPELVLISTMSNRNVLSTYLCMALCVGVVMFIQNKDKLNMAYFGMSCAIFYMLILGQTEGGYVGIILSLVLLIPMIAKNMDSLRRMLFVMGIFLLEISLSAFVHLKRWAVGSSWAPFKYYFIILAAVLIAGSAILNLVKQNREFKAKIYYPAWYVTMAVILIAAVIAIPQLAQISQHKAIQGAAAILSGNLDDQLGSGRIFAWRRALPMVFEKPFFGYGPDGFKNAFNAVYREETLEVFGWVFDKAHNEYLQIAIDNGILGLLAILSFYGAVLVKAFKSKADFRILALIFALTGFLIQAFFNIFTPFAHPVAWALWGILAAYSYAPERDAATHL